MNPFGGATSSLGSSRRLHSFIYERWGFDVRDSRQSKVMAMGGSQYGVAQSLYGGSSSCVAIRSRDSGSQVAAHGSSGLP